MRSNLLARQTGFVEIALAFSLLVLSAISLNLLKEWIEESRHEAADTAGVMAAQVKHALRAAIAEQGTGLTPGTYQGTAWLKDSGSCASGTGSRPYLPCAFTDRLPLELSYSTVVSVTGTTVSATVTLGAPTSNGEVFPSLGGVVSTAINGSSNDYVTPATQTYHVANHNKITGVVTFAVTNSIENLEFLKKDGTVLPTNDFNWNNNDITNIAHLGANTIQATSTVTAEQLTSTDDITAADRVTASTLYAQRLYDTNNPAFYVDPSGSSQLNALDVHSIRDRDNPGYTWDGSGTSRMNYADLNVARLRNSYAVGGACATKQIGTTSSGELLSCVSGAWQKAGGVSIRSVRGYSFGGSGTVYTRYHHICSIQRISNLEDSHYCQLSRIASSGGMLRYVLRGYKSGCQALCIDYN